MGKEPGAGSRCRRDGMATGKGEIEIEVWGRKFDHIPSKA